MTPEEKDKGLGRGRTLEEDLAMLDEIRRLRDEGRDEESLALFKAFLKHPDPNHCTNKYPHVASCPECGYDMYDIGKDD
jgi:hypothetical protein